MILIVNDIMKWHNDLRYQYVVGIQRFFGSIKVILCLIKMMYQNIVCLSSLSCLNDAKSKIFGI